MGTLYYVAKMDGSRELFALNKVYTYDHGNVLRECDGRSFAETFGSVETLAERLRAATDADDYDWDILGWLDRIAARLFAWSGAAPLKFISEYGIDEFHAGLEYDDHIALITGSAYDDDYEADGATYKRDSAW